jgi:hypothetical protein
MRAWFTLTVDVEEEWDWGKGFPVEHYSVRNTAKLPAFQEFCRGLGIRPTYFVNWAIISDPDSVQLIKRLASSGECEIGAHIHPWNTDPVEEDCTDHNSHIVNLPLPLVQAKLRNLTDRIHSAIGKYPTSFRSGRWGTNGKILSLLSSLGYQVDSSVLPFYADSTFSYETASLKPYWPDFSDFLHPGSQRKIFEIPATTGYTRGDSYQCNRVYKLLSSKLGRLHLVGALQRVGFLKKVFLSPELASGEEMVQCIRSLSRTGYGLFNMALHSSSLLVGGSPYSSSEADITQLLSKITKIVSFCKNTFETQFCTLTEYRNMEAHV